MCRNEGYDKKESRKKIKKNHDQKEPEHLKN